MGSMGATPIIDWRTYGDASGDIHDRIRTFATRARLLAANGRADNLVILTLPPFEGRGSLLDPNSPFNVRSNEVLRLMDQWLDDIAQDTSMEDRAVKVARHKPAELVDGHGSYPQSRCRGGLSGRTSRSSVDATSGPDRWSRSAFGSADAARGSPGPAARRPPGGRPAAPPAGARGSCW